MSELQKLNESLTGCLPLQKIMVFVLSTLTFIFQALQYESNFSSRNRSSLADSVINTVKQNHKQFYIDT